MLRLALHGPRDAQVLLARGTAHFAVSLARGTARVDKGWARVANAPRHHHLRYACLAAFATFVLLCTASRAQAEGVVEGAYRATAAQIEVKVTTWGDDCGPRPTSRSEPGGDARVRTSGTALIVQLPDRTLRSDACWSANPAVHVVKNAVAGTTRSIECRTPDSDAKREIGRYTLTEGANHALTLVDDSRYDWQLKTSHCVASVTRTQSLRSLVAGEPATAQVLETEPVGVPCTAGPLAKLRLRPAESRIEPGQRVCFQVRGYDAAGCEIAGAVQGATLSLARPDKAQGALNGLCFASVQRTAVAEGMFRITAEASGLRAEAHVRVAAPDLSAITSQRESSEGQFTGVPPAVDEGVLDAGIRAVVKSAGGNAWLVGGLLSVAALLIAAALIARKRRIAAAAEHARAELERAELRAERSRASHRQSTPSATATEQWVCPRCRRGYPGGEGTCVTDGEKLLPYAEFAQRSIASARPAAACSNCGAALTSDAAFCGRCGGAQAR